MTPKIASIFLLLASTMLFGCAIQTQAAAHQVAYDFSDRDFYDRSYAPSPTYATIPPYSMPEREAPARH